MDKIRPILSCIAEADSGDLSRIAQATVVRYKELFPGDEVYFLSLPEKDRAKRAAILRHAAELLEHEG